MVFLGGLCGFCVSRAGLCGFLCVGFTWVFLRGFMWVSCMACLSGFLE